MSTTNKRWTVDSIKIEADKYTTKSEFRKGIASAYQAAKRRKILDKVCAHMVPAYKQWTEEDIQVEADKHKTRRAFELGNRNAYDAARRAGILNEVCAHMKLLLMSWTEETIRAEASKYLTRNKFKEGSSKAYDAARKRKILGEVCAHMTTPERKRKWTKYSIQDEANKYQTRNEFRKGSENVYQAARSLNILGEVCVHMEFIQMSWTHKAIQAEANKYLTRSDFNHGSVKAYKSATHNGILDKVCSHMVAGEGVSDNDLFYVWKPKAHTNLYKIGISSQRFGDRRINEVARNFNNEKDIILKLKVKDARSIETHILNAYPEYEFDASFNGSTEFRQLTESQLEYVKHYARCHA